MLSFTDLTKMARSRVDDAKVLFAAGRYDGAAYIIGYAVEFKLKARIATGILAARSFPETPAEFDRLAKLKNHRLEELLELSGRKGKVTTSTMFKSKWSFLVSQWKPESRYNKVGTVTAQVASDMIGAVEFLLRAL
jgi:HEPN domain-containing protein